MKPRLSIVRTGDVLVPLPEYQSPGAAGLDLCAAVKTAICLAPGERLLIPTGLKLEIPNGLEGQVRPRSGLALKQGVTVLNAPGTIDSDYRGEVGVVLINHGDKAVSLQPLERIAQLVLTPVVQVEVVELSELSSTARGSGGYGSTGA